MRLLTILVCLVAGLGDGARSLSIPRNQDQVASAPAKRQASTSTSTPASIINTDVFPNSPLNATAWALIYTYPLAIFSSWAGGVLRNHSVNEFFHQRNLATPNDPGVIKPNVDTLYSRVVLDLSETDLVLTVPEITDRYWVYPIYDPFGNNLAEIGIVNDNKPGDYLIRRALLGNETIGYSNDTSTFDSSAYQGVVTLPGTHATMLIRLLLVQNTTDNLETVHGYQNESSLTAIAKDDTDAEIWGPTPPLPALAVNDSLLGINTPQKQLEFAAQLVQYNPPLVRTDQRRVFQILDIAGLSQGNFTRVEGVNLTEAAVIANASITADVQDPEHIRPQSNDWQLSTPTYQGDFGTNYASAAYVALAGYQQQSVNQTLYPGFRSLGFTSKFTLEEGGALLLSFSGKPKLNEAKYGFWSLSVYGEDEYLIPNELNRFEVGDRTYNLTYEDGQPIYGPDADDERDDPFQILVQPANVTPPGNWTNNWLPASSKFSWLCKSLRWYVPELAMTDGNYIYPEVENITAITEVQSNSPVV
ncbi:uncharacterized protein HMPREF1541_07068 [Cyphellophora europaea CBS 101466]|uniref:DUF1254 domain-containing protein n=1 Tax=Cyphellophora europaea (strain CBS 101466) TaxID=1220924 RepID=W2RR88_CYPE1|nr:uncharacterized protein HMPREF1541_07068 [Cyphellophora europaea CBS 101466]ETN39026.1 hypothetical protein HMPREF1541_07068 [Cyphellophora europaea CBS 101466]